MNRIFSLLMGFIIIGIGSTILMAQSQPQMWNGSKAVGVFPLTPLPTFTPTITQTPTVTTTATSTATPTITNTPPNTPSGTSPTWTATNTDTATATSTPTSTATNTITFTPTSTYQAAYYSMGVTVPMSAGVSAYSFTIPRISGIVEILPTDNIDALGVSLYGLPPGAGSNTLPTFTNGTIGYATSSVVKLISIYTNSYGGVLIGSPVSQIGFVLNPAITITPGSSWTAIVTYSLFCQEKSIEYAWDEYYFRKTFWGKFLTFVFRG